MWTSKRREEKGETVDLVQSKRVHTTKPGCISFLNAARLKHHHSEGLGAGPMQAVS